MMPRVTSSRFAGALVLYAASSSCALVISAEWDRYSEGEPESAGAGGATSGAGGTGASTGEVCAPRAKEACYEGPAETRQVGTCRSGTRVCNDEGTSWGPCSGQTLPIDEDCATDADEDCNMLACGQASWTTTFATNSGSAVVTTDSAGNIYLAGSFTGFIDLGEDLLTSTGANDADLFVAKLDRQGEIVWSRQFDETGGHYRPYAIASDGDGGIVFCGSTDEGAIDFGGGQIAGDRAGSYIVRLDDAGGYLWHQFYEDDYLTDLFMDRSGSIVASSMFGLGSELGHIAQIAIEDGAITRRIRACDEPDGDTCGDDISNLQLVGGPNDTVVAVTSDSNARDRVTVRKYDSSLGHLWSVDLSSPGSAFGVWDLVGDAPGSIYIMGIFSGQLQVENGVTLFTSDPAETEIFLVKLSSLGEHEWGKSFGGAGHRPNWTMSVSDAGELAIFGTFSGSLDLGGGALTTTTVNDEDLDLVLAKLDADGSHLWSRQLGDSSRQESSGSMVIDSEGTVLIAGSLNGTAVDFGTGATGADEGWSVFLARFPRP